MKKLERRKYDLKDEIQDLANQLIDARQEVYFYIGHTPLQDEAAVNAHLDKA